MASITNPEASKPAETKPAAKKPAQRSRLPEVLIFVSFLLICGYVAFSSHFRYPDFSGNSDQVISLLLQQNKQIQASLTSMTGEIESLKREASGSQKRVDSQGLSDEFRETVNSELELLRLSYKKLLKERDVMQQQIEELRNQLKFVQNSQLTELKNSHHREVEKLRGEILYAKKEFLLIIQDLVGHSFDEKIKSKFNEDIFSDKNKEGAKSKSTEWIENAYQTVTSFVTESIPKAAGDLGDSAKNSFEKVKTLVDETAPKVAKTIKVSAKETIEKVKDVTQQVGESAKEGIKKAKTFVDEKAPKVAETIKVSAQETFEKVKNLGKQVGESAKEGMKKAETFVHEKAPEVEQFGKAAKEKLENVKEFVEEKASKIGETAKEGVEKVKNFVGEKAPEVIQKIEETAKEGFESMKNYVGKTAPKVANQVEEAAKEAFEGLKNVGGKAKEAGEKITEQAKKLSESLLNLWKK